MAGEVEAAAAFAEFITKAFGKQVGQPAPVFNPGAPSGLLGGDPSQAALGGLAQQGNFGQPLSPELQEAETFQLPSSPEDIQANDEPGLLGRVGQGIGDFGGGFFDTIDAQFQSPARTLGIGLLNQHRPGAGTAGLGLMGLLGGLRNAFGGN